MPKPYPLGPFDPTLVIATVKDRPPEMTIDGNLWHRKLQLPSLAIYTRDPVTSAERTGLARERRGCYRGGALFRWG